MKAEPIAVLCSDIHLSLKQPACRADDWLSVQRDYLHQLRSLQRRTSRPSNSRTNIGPADNDDLPILCAGDIFDKWNPPPELIRFALEYLPPDMICVPGQHDLPNHSFGEIHRSAYGVLREAGKIQCAATHRRQEVPSRSFISVGNWNVYGFAWGEEVTPPVAQLDRPALALVHQYVWTVEASYQGAPEASHLNQFMKPLKPYKVAVFGDNHKGFLKQLKTGTTVLNCGGFIRRKSDEVRYEPRVGLLHADGSIKLHKLDTSKDQFRTPEEMASAVEVDMTGFVEELSRLGEHGLDFRESVHQAVDSGDLPGPVREKVLKCLAEDKAVA